MYEHDKVTEQSGAELGQARVRSAQLTSDNNAISVQLQLQLPTGTELGNKLFCLFCIS